MNIERAKELLNAVVDDMLVAEKCSTVIEKLMYLGFTADELIEDFSFSLTDVREVEENMEEEEI